MNFFPQSPNSYVAKSEDSEPKIEKRIQNYLDKKKKVKKK